MKWYTKIGIGILAISLSAVPIDSIRYKKKNIKKYCEDRVVEIIKEHEEKLGIKYQKVPKITISVPEEENHPPGALGSYNAETDTIYLYRDPEENVMVNTKTSKVEGDNKEDSLDTILHHEIGHAYVYQLSEWEPNWIWIQNNEEFSSDTKYCMKLISEGIAEYLRRKTIGQKDHPFYNDVAHIEWPDFPPLSGLAALFYRHTTYDGGYFFVRPIIDTYGQKGIEYLIARIPDITHPKQIPLYQKKILKEMEEISEKQ